MHFFSNALIVSGKDLQKYVSKRNPEMVSNIFVLVFELVLVIHHIIDTEISEIPLPLPQYRCTVSEWQFFSFLPKHFQILCLTKTQKRGVIYFQSVV